ncbi:MAG: hypothetical protein PHX21_12950 [bacterium]|nr:hypothetical protein [bacterium]
MKPVNHGLTFKTVFAILEDNNYHGENRILTCVNEGRNADAKVIMNILNSNIYNQNIAINAMYFLTYIKHILSTKDIYRDGNSRSDLIRAINFYKKYNIKTPTVNKIKALYKDLLGHKEIAGRVGRGVSASSKGYYGSISGKTSKCEIIYVDENGKEIYKTIRTSKSPRTPRDWGDLAQESIFWSLEHTALKGYKLSDARVVCGKGTCFVYLKKIAGNVGRMVVVGKRIKESPRSRAIKKLKEFNVEKIARAAFYGSYPKLMERVSWDRGYVLNGRKYPANSMSLREAIDTIKKYPASTISKLIHGKVIPTLARSKAVGKKLRPDFGSEHDFQEMSNRYGKYISITDFIKNNKSRYTKQQFRDFFDIRGIDLKSFEHLYKEAIELKKKQVGKGISTFKTKRTPYSLTKIMPKYPLLEILDGKVWTRVDLPEARLQLAEIKKVIDKTFVKKFIHSYHNLIGVVGVKFYADPVVKSKKTGRLVYKGYEKVGKSIPTGITQKQWDDKKKHRYTSIIKGRKYILTQDKAGTCLLPVKIISSAAKRKPVGDGEYISVYTTKQAIEDGELIPISETSTLPKEAGFKAPVLITRGVMEILKVPEGVKYQDFDGRLWDLLSMARYQVRRMIKDNDTFGKFSCKFHLKEGMRLKEFFITFNRAEGHFTIMKPGEY